MKLISKSLIKFGLSEITAKAIPFGVNLYIAKLLGPENFGSFVIVWTIWELFLIFIPMNIHATIKVYFFKKSAAELSDIVVIQIICSATLASICALLIGFAPLKQLIGESSLIVYLLISSAFFKTISNGALAYLQCKKSENWYVLINLVYVFSVAIISVALLTKSNYLLIWSGGIFVGAALQCMLALFKVSDLLKFPNWHEANLSQIVRFASKFYAQGFIWWLKPIVDRALITTVMGLTALGEFSLAMQLASSLLVFLNAWTLVMLPKLNSSLSIRDYDALQSVLKDSYLAVFIATLLVTFAGYFFIVTAYKDGYANVGSYFLLLVVSLVPQMLLLLKINILYFYNDGLFFAKWLIAYFVLYFIAMFFLQDLISIAFLAVISFLYYSVLLVIVEVRVKQVVLRELRHPDF